MNGKGFRDPEEPLTTSRRPAPGERWMYGTSAIVLGVLISRAAGAPLDVFLRERLFAPSG